MPQYLMNVIQPDGPPSDCLPTERSSADRSSPDDAPTRAGESDAPVASSGRT